MNTKSRKRIALCFHGIHGGESTGKNYHSTDFEKGENNSSIRVLETSHRYLYENIINYNVVKYVERLSKKPFTFEGKMYKFKNPMKQINFYNAFCKKKIPKTAIKIESIKYLNY